MKIADCGHLLSGDLRSALITAPERTSLHATAEDILEMDRIRPRREDLPFPRRLGQCPCCILLRVRVAPFRQQQDILRCSRGPARSAPRLNERPCHCAENWKRRPGVTTPARYCPGIGYCLPGAGNRDACRSRTCPCITALYARQGGVFRLLGQPQDALACFSYGHGWLDAAVRSGLFSIVSTMTCLRCNLPA